jgi:hypothetical protein
VREDLLSPPELDRVGQVTHHLVDEPIRPARPGQDLDEPLVRADTNDRETHQRYRLELFPPVTAVFMVSFRLVPSGVNGSAYGPGQLCGVNGASVLFEQVAGLIERLGEAARADDDRRVVASRFDVEHQVAVLEDGVAD